MKFIGITGGVGAGKSTILAYLRKNYRVRTLVADEVAHEIMEPGYDCYVRLQKEFAQEKIWLHNGRFNRQKLAEVIFADDEKRERLNSIVHPAVKEYILKEVERERRSGSTDYVVLEAALLIEDGYDKICDELWYVFVTEENRKKRLIENRGYSDEKIAQMFAAQLPEGEYRRHCRVIIDNNGPIAQVYLQLAQLLNDKGDRKMQRVLGQEEDTQKNEIQYVFGLDIGTRNVVGTVGYKKEKEFIVVAQYALEHETRAMLDGQIHDIGRVGRTISLIKEKLEDQIGQELTEVCIAAAGRVLKTVTTYVEYEFSEETVVTGEHIHTLELLGVDKAAQELKEANDTKYKFYCVGYSVMKYYINDEIFSNIESHKADVISAKIIVTFLPEDVVDGLYMAVGFAGLTVANMTLEPIAAIDVAIPENFRMLNIALVDVGAGTSDISLTRDGSIIAYGMIPFAGDELTEMIVQHYLVDFKMAEHIKLSSATENEIEFEDIMSLKHTITAEEVWKLTEPLVDKMSTDVADKIRELNGDQSVSATFIVGGGGKIHGFDEMLAKKLELPQERVALRGEEVLKEVTFLQDDIVKDPLLVTPIGICLNYYEQKNNFIMVRFNGERLKLYDNNKLTIVDAAIQAGFPNDQLFPKRGREINFTVNGRPRIVRGDAGEAAIIRMNDRPASINTPIEPNCEITIEPSTAGREAHYMVGQLEEYHSSTITFEVNGKLITCPRYVEVNGILEPPTYEIKENDAIVTRSFYTVEQLAEFMDVELDMDADILVNNRVEDLQALVYENFSVDWKVISYRSTPQDVYPDAPPKRVPEPGKKKTGKNAAGYPAIPALPQIPANETAVKDIPSEIHVTSGGIAVHSPVPASPDGIIAQAASVAVSDGIVQAALSGGSIVHPAAVAAGESGRQLMAGGNSGQPAEARAAGEDALQPAAVNAAAASAGTGAADAGKADVNASGNASAPDHTADVSAGRAETNAAAVNGGKVQRTGTVNAAGAADMASSSAGAKSAVPSDAGAVQNAAASDAGGAQSAVPSDAGRAQSAVPSDAGRAQSAVPSDAGRAQSAVPSDAGRAQSAVSSDMNGQETAFASTAGTKDTAVPDAASVQNAAASGAAGTQNAESSGAADMQNAAASGAAGAQNAVLTGAAGTQNAESSGAADMQNAAASGAAGTQNAVLTGAADMQNAAASGAAGTQNAAASGAAGTQNAVPSGAAGTQNAVPSGAAGTQNAESSGAADMQNAAASGAAGTQNAVPSGAAGTQNAESSGAAGMQNAVTSGAAGMWNAASADVFGKRFTDMVSAPAGEESVSADTAALPSGTAHGGRNAGSAAVSVEKGPAAYAVETARPSAESHESGSVTNESGQPFQVTVNGETVTLKNKKEYIFVDIFEHITFDLSQSRGRMLKTEVNGTDAQYTQLLQPGDKISIYWKEG